MAAKKKKKKAAKKAAVKRVTGAALSAKLGHKPLSLLRTYRRKMGVNAGKLDALIARREAAGE